MPVPYTVPCFVMWTLTDCPTDGRCVRPAKDHWLPLVADEMLPSAVTCAVRLGETLPLGLCPCYVPHRPSLSFSAVSLQAAVSVWAGRVGGGRGRLDSPARGVPLGTGRGLPYPGRAPL